MKDRYVLSLDGGGVRGIIPLKIIEKANIDIKKFDIIAGTSIGGIIALGLNFYTPTAMLELLKTFSKNIFRTSVFRDLKTQQGWIEAKHDKKEFKKVLEAIFLNGVFSMCEARTLITSFDIQKRQPKIYKNYQQPDGQMALRDIAYNTAAAPTYFKSDRMIDGGLFQNNPAMIAALEAQLIYPNEKIHLLSLGTGKNTTPINPGRGGKFQWAGKIMDVVMDATTEGVNYMVANSFPDINYLRIQTALKKDIELSDYNKIDILEKIGQELYFENIEKITYWKRAGGLI